MNWKNFEISSASKLLIQKVEAWVEALIAGLPNFLVAAFVVVLAFLLAKLARRISEQVLERVVSNRAVSRLLENMVYIFVVFAGIFVALGILNLDKTVTSLLAGAGVLGLALGFAFQEIAANFIAGVLIAFRKPFSLNDLVEIKNYYGRVTSINMRTTTITTLQGLDAIIPNKTMFTEAFLNYTATDIRRMDLTVGVSYGESLEHVEAVVLDCLKDVQGRDQTKEIEFFYTMFDNSSINFEVRFWLHFQDEKDFLSVRHQAVKKIKKAFDENGVTIPFPIRTLDFGIKGGQTLASCLEEAKAAPGLQS